MVQSKVEFDLFLVTIMSEGRGVYVWDCGGDENADRCSFTISNRVIPE